MPLKKGSLVNNSYISETILILKTLSFSAVCPFDAKVQKDPIKHQESIVNKT